jgi:hypothetical protein
MLVGLGSGRPVNRHTGSPGTSVLHSFVEARTNFIDPGGMKFFISVGQVERLKVELSTSGLQPAL